MDTNVLELKAPMNMSSSRYRLIMMAKWCLKSQEELRERLGKDREVKPNQRYSEAWAESVGALPGQVPLLRVKQQILHSQKLIVGDYKVLVWHFSSFAVLRSRALAVDALGI